MFSGIIEARSPILRTENLDQAVRIFLQKPPDFTDLKLGDSIACDGVCLTLEAQTDSEIVFTAAAETIKVLKWSSQSWQSRVINLERSLRFGDRIHGHLVTGHVDSLGEVLVSETIGDSWILKTKVESSVLPFIWKKGSITLNGVSLTVNAIEDSVVEVCLIPETVKRTNLGLLKKGSWINVEPDYMAKAMMRAIESGKVVTPTPEVQNGL
ncbi:MAG: riboflavin synthase [Pseudobdellovibrionaceae bacterium]